MLKKLLKPKNKGWATNKKSPPTLAVAAILLKMLKTDGHKSTSEIRQLREMLKSEFELDDKSVARVIENAEASENRVKDLPALAEEVRNNWGNARRVQLLEYLWVMAYADDRIDPKEMAMINKLGELLYLTESEKDRAQSAAEARVGLDNF